MVIVLGWTAVGLLFGIGLTLIAWDLTAPAPPARPRYRHRRVLDQSRVVDGVTYPSRTVAEVCGVEPRKAAR